jgi:hypothetical protein
LTPYIEELIEVIRKKHGVGSTHRHSVPVKEVLNGKTIWEGVVEVFDLDGHQQANRAYAWSHESDNPEKPWRSITVLHVPPAISAETAVRASVLRELGPDAEAEA